MVSVSEQVTRIGALLALIAAAGVLAASAGAQEPTVWGGGTISSAGIGSESLSFVRAGNTVRARVAFGITCGHVDYVDNVVNVRGAIRAEGVFTATGSTRVTGHGRLTVRIDGMFSQALGEPIGNVTVASVGIHCTGWTHEVKVRARIAPVGKPMTPLPQWTFAGLTAQSAGGTMPLAILVGVSDDAKAVDAVWQAQMHCGPRARLPVLNFSPRAPLQPDGTFLRRETYTLRYPDHSSERYRVTFMGRILSDGAKGTVRARMQLHKRGHHYFPCDSGTVPWTATQ